MIKRGLSQEALKITACITMLIDHIGYIFFPGHIWLRLVGRLALPIYCFLLAEGAHYTRNASKYALRLLIGILLSEIPFDLLFFRKITWDHQSIMLTLLLGFLMCRCMAKCRHFIWKALVFIPFALAARYLHTDYSSRGIAVIALFFLTRELPFRQLLQLLGLAFLFCRSGFVVFHIGPWGVPWTAFALCAMIPICLYSGKKVSASPAVQTAFYLFYPVHLVLLLALAIILF